MSARARTVAAIVVALRGEFGNVVRGRIGLPTDPLPCVAVAGASVRSTKGTPHYWQRTASVDVDLWDACGETDLDARVERSEELADRATDALEAAFADPNNELYLREDFAVESAALGNDLDAVPDGFARALVVVTFGYRERGT